MKVSSGVSKQLAKAVLFKTDVVEPFRRNT